MIIVSGLHSIVLRSLRLLLASLLTVIDRHTRQSELSDEVERVWSAIAERDDWQPLYDKVAAVRALGKIYGR